MYGSARVHKLQEERLSYRGAFQAEGNDLSKHVIRLMPDKRPHRNVHSVEMQLRGPVVNCMYTSERFKKVNRLLSRPLLRHLLLSWLITGGTSKYLNVILCKLSRRRAGNHISGKRDTPRAPRQRTHERNTSKYSRKWASIFPCKLKCKHLKTKWFTYLKTLISFEIHEWKYLP